MIATHRRGARAPALVVMALSWQTGMTAQPVEARPPVIRVGGTEAGKPGWTVEAERAPLDRVLTELGAKAGMKIHFSVLPRDAVTATCAGDSVEQVLRCLLGDEVDVVVRSAERKPADNASAALATELWVLGSSHANARGAAADCAGTGDATGTDGARTSAKAEETGQLLGTAASARDANTRASALSRLIADAPRGDPEVRAGLERALSDRSGDVRAQAVYGLARREGPQVAAVLQAALRDEDASVRLMAVDSAWNDENGAALLREALSDADETVREAAAMKLQERGEETAAPP